MQNVVREKRVLGNYPFLSSYKSNTNSVNYQYSILRRKEKYDFEEYSKHFMDETSQESIAEVQLLSQKFLNEKATNHLIGLPPGENVLEDEKHYSVLPDMYRGWKPKLRYYGPIRINFEQRFLDSLVYDLIRSELKYYQIIYLGFLPEDTFQMHDKYSGKQTYDFRYINMIEDRHQFIINKMRETGLLGKLISSQLEKKKKSKRDQSYDSESPQRNPLMMTSIHRTRPFIGMDSNFSSTLQFNSMFESANLDTVLQTNPAEFDLFMRVDSNSKGHTNWFFFSVENTKKGETVKFNIRNFTKRNSLYTLGLKPYVWISKREGNTNHKIWRQAGENLTYQPSKMIYNTRIANSFLKKTIYTLSFEYKFDGSPEDIFYFSAQPPYTYSDLQRFIAKLSEKQKTSKFENRFLSIWNFTKSLSGMGVPLITITDFQDQSIQLEHRNLIYIIARVHPAETNPSYLLEGFMEYLCLETSAEVLSCLKNCVFKIVPMITPEGCILGNYKTDITGDDINKIFDSYDKNIHPVLNALVEIIDQDRRQYYKKPLYFFDIHSHNLRPNAFAKTNRFAESDPEKYLCRIFLKAMEKKMNSFRSISLQEKEMPKKKLSAMSFFENRFRFIYTFYMSSGLYKTKGINNKEFLPFDSESFKSMGMQFAEGLLESINMIDLADREQIMKDHDLLRSIDTIIAQTSEKEVISGEPALVSAQQPISKPFFNRNSSRKLLSGSGEKSREKSVKVSHLCAFIESLAKDEVLRIRRKKAFEAKKKEEEQKKKHINSLESTKETEDKSRTKLEDTIKEEFSDLDYHYGKSDSDSDDEDFGLGEKTVLCSDITTRLAVYKTIWNNEFLLKDSINNLMANNDGSFGKKQNFRYVSKEGDGEDDDEQNDDNKKKNQAKNSKDLDKSKNKKGKRDLTTNSSLNGKLGLDGTKPSSARFQNFVSKSTRVTSSSLRNKSEFLMKWESNDDMNDESKRNDQQKEKSLLRKSQSSLLSGDGIALQARNFNNNELAKLQKKGPPEFGKSPIPSHFFGIHRKIVKRAKKEYFEKEQRLMALQAWMDGSYQNPSQKNQLKIKFPKNLNSFKNSLF